LDSRDSVRHETCFGWNARGEAKSSIGKGEDMDIRGEAGEGAVYLGSLVLKEVTGVL
jgi:hypothetical protein